MDKFLGDVLLNEFGFVMYGSGASLAPVTIALCQFPALTPFLNN